MEYESSLPILERFLAEFYDDGTTNQRKKEIEEYLFKFSSNENVWFHCLEYLDSTSNDCVMMYCLNILEILITKHWSFVAAGHRSEVRFKLCELLMKRYKLVPNFVSNKIGKLIALIGRQEWPSSYPDFFHNIYQLAQAANTAPIGLMLIRIAFEELLSSKDDISGSRKMDLRALIYNEVPTVSNIICGHLDNVLAPYAQTLTSTPPPSPIHIAEEDQSTLFSTSPLCAGSILNRALSPRRTHFNHFHQMPDLDVDSYNLCALSLKCLTQLLGWTPLTSCVTSSVITVLFNYASFGCNPKLYSETSSYSNIEGTNVDLAIHAMDCLNEIISTKYFPVELEELLLQMFQETFNILQHLTKNSPIIEYSASKPILADINESFAEKFTYFLSTFITLHLRRFENDPRFQIATFLALLFKYTFLQNVVQGFYSCLDIWNNFMDDITDTMKSKYRCAFVAFNDEIFKRLQFTANYVILEELDDEELDEDFRTQWQTFLQQCVEIVEKLSRIVPSEVNRLMTSMFQANLRMYTSLESFLNMPDSPMEPKTLVITAENDIRVLHCCLKDLSSALQLIGRMVVHMLEDYETKKHETLDLLHRVCETSKFSNEYRFYNINTIAPEVLKNDFIEVHAQINSTLKAFCEWLAVYTGETKAFTNLAEPFEEKLEFIMSSIKLAITSNIKGHVPPKVLHTACQLFMSFTTSVRAPILFSWTEFNVMFTEVCGERIHNLTMTQKLVNRSISNMLLLPWKCRSNLEQNWSERISIHFTFIQTIAQSLAWVDRSSGFFLDKYEKERVKPRISWTLRVFSDLISNMYDAPSISKVYFYQSFQCSMIAIESLLNIYIDDTEVTECVLDFYMALFTNLKVQMGSVAFDQTVQNFLNVMDRNQFKAGFDNEEATLSIASRVLRLLKCIIGDNHGASKYVPYAVSLCMDKVYPMITQRDSPDVKLAMFELLHCVLYFNWRFFVKSQTSVSTSPDNDVASFEDILENEAIFYRIIEAFGSSLLLSDLAVFKQNLAALEDLNRKWKLYHRNFFKGPGASYLNRFMEVLFTRLIEKSHGLFEDEIGYAIYNMASVNFKNFFKDFLPYLVGKMQYLNNIQKNELMNGFNKDTDCPTFLQSIARFVNDIGYFIACAPQPVQ